MGVAFYTLVTIIGTILFLAPTIIVPAIIGRSLVAVFSSWSKFAQHFLYPMDLGFASGLGLFLLMVILPTVHIFVDDGKRGGNRIAYGIIGFFLLVGYSTYVYFMHMGNMQIWRIEGYMYFVYNFMFRGVGVVFGLIFYILTLTTGKEGREEMLKLAFFFLIAFLILYAIFGIILYSTQDYVCFIRSVLAFWWWGYLDCY